MVEYNGPTNKNLYGAAYNINLPAAPYNEHGENMDMNR